VEETFLPAVPVLLPELILLPYGLVVDLAAEFTEFPYEVLLFIDRLLP
jgi:hypothetical protein